MVEKIIKKKKGLRERKRPDVKGIVDKGVGPLNLDVNQNSFQEEKSHFDFNPKEIKISKKILNKKEEVGEEELEPLLSTQFLDRWKKSLEIDS